MPSVFEVRSRDHEEVKQMLSEFEKGPTAANGAGQDQPARRKKMAETLVIEESKHEAVEEMYFCRPCATGCPTAVGSLTRRQDRSRRPSRSWPG